MFTHQSWPIAVQDDDHVTHNPITWSGGDISRDINLSLIVYENKIINEMALLNWLKFEQGVLGFQIMKGRGYAYWFNIGDNVIAIVNMI